MADFREDIVEGLIARLYAVADGSAGWTDAVEAIRVAFNASSAILHGADDGGAYSILGRSHLPDDLMRPYAEHWHVHDPWVRTAARHPVGQAYTGGALVPFEEMRRSAFYSEWMGPVLGVDDAIGGIVHVGGEPGPTLGVLQARGREGYGPGDIAAMQRLLPHLGRAIVIETRFARQLRGSGDTAAALDVLGDAVVLCRADGRVCFANVAARQVHARRLGLRIDGRIGAAQAATETALSALIAEVARAGGPARAFRMPARDGRALLLTVAPLGPGTREAGPDRAAEVMVLITDGAADPSAARLAALFGLSAAEAEVAVGLVAGLRPDAIALRRGVRIATVRTQVASIFAKSGTAGQAEFIRLAGSLPRLVEE